MNIVSNAKLNVLYEKNKKHLTDTYHDSLLYTYGLGVFVINREFILWLDYLIRQANLEIDVDKHQAVVIDSNDQPIHINDINTFRETIYEIYCTVNNQYLNDLAKLKNNYISGELE